ncbi:MAG: hypothetical protein LBT59_01860 [Clostridiales bacterium]|jgi:hypothetical protein|nr:hypothetical protein [Clostridiales bacterium]
MEMRGGEKKREEMGWMEEKGSREKSDGKRKEAREKIGCREERRGIGVGWLKHRLIPWQEVSWMTGKGRSEGKKGEVRRFGVQEIGRRERIGCREEVQGVIGVG